MGSESPLDADSSVLDRYFWDRHANPWSGWSRVASLPLLMLCIYRRNWRALGVVIAFVVVNPILFSPPADDSAWMTRVVYGERLWLTQDRDRYGYPEILNYANGVATLYAVYAAVRRRPAEMTLATALSMTLKLWFVAEMVHYYEDAQSSSSLG